MSVLGQAKIATGDSDLDSEIGMGNQRRGIDCAQETIIQSHKFTDSAKHVGRPLMRIRTIER